MKKRLFIIIGALTAWAGGAVAQTDVFSDDFSDGERTGWFSSAGKSSLNVAGGALVQTTATAGRSALTYFDATSLINVGDAITLSLELRIDGPAGSAFGTAQGSNNQLRIGLFSSENATKVEGDNYGSGSYGTGSQYNFATQKGYASVMSLMAGSTNTDGSPAGWTIRSRTGDNLALISTTSPFTAVGTSEMPTASFAVDTLYTITLIVQRSETGVDVTSTVSGGAFGASTSYTRSDETAPQAKFDLLAVHLNSNVGASFTIDNVKVTYTAAGASGDVAPTIVTPPLAQTAVEGGSATFTVVASGTAPLAYQWKKDGVAIDGATTATLTLSDVQLTAAGDYSVTISNAKGEVTSEAVALTVEEANTPPSIRTQPAAHTVVAGGPVSFSVTAGGASPLTYQWKKDGDDLAGQTEATLTLNNVQESDAGAYSVVVTNAFGEATSETAVLTVLPEGTVLSRIANLSVRASVGTGDNILIVGTVIGGSGTSGGKATLVQAMGPALEPLKVSNFLKDPMLATFRGSAQIEENDNWGGDAKILAVGTRVGASSFPNEASKDAAIYTEARAAGAYTLHVFGAGSSTGVALAEIYDATPEDELTPTTPRLMNVSGRARVGTGDDVLIAGFVIAGNGPKTVLIRGVGPALTKAKVTDALADPKLTLYHEGTAMAENDNWGTDDPSLPEVFKTIGASELDANSKDAALLITLQPGIYTAHVSGVGSTTGVALVEVYDVEDSAK